MISRCPRTSGDHGQGNEIEGHRIPHTFADGWTEPVAMAPLDVAKALRDTAQVRERSRLAGQKINEQYFEILLGDDCEAHASEEETLP